MFKWAVSYATPTGLTLHDAAQGLTTLYKKQIQSVKLGEKTYSKRWYMPIYTCNVTNIFITNSQVV